MAGQRWTSRPDQPILRGVMPGRKATYPIAATGMAVAMLLGGCASAPPGDGPLPVRNQHPAQLTVQHLDPVAARTLPMGGVRLQPTMGYSSLFLLKGTAATNFRMDAELLRAGLRLDYGMTGDLMLSVEPAAMHTTGGFLDGFLIDYHRLFSMPDQDRSDIDRNRFDVTAVKDGTVVYRMDERSAMLADLPISLAWAAAQATESNPGLLFRAGVEAPIGDEDSGAGNGEWDKSLGIATSWPLAFGTLHGHLQHTWAGTPTRSRQAGFTFADVTSAGLGLEWGVTERLSAVVQTEWETATLRRLPLGATQRDHWLLWTGGRYVLGERTSFEFSLGEDLVGHASPDVTFWFGFTWRGSAL